MMKKIQLWASRNKAFLLLALFLAVGAPLSPTFIKIVAGTGIAGGTQTVYPGGSANVALDVPVIVTSGGTGATSFTIHGPLVGRGTSAVDAISPGTSGQVLVSNGASFDPSFQDLASATSGYVSLASTYSHSAANGVWTATPFYFTLPSAGTFWVSVALRYQVAGAGGYCATRLYDASLGSVVTDSELMMILNTASSTLQSTVTKSMPISITGGAHTLNVQMQCGSAPSWGARQLVGDGLGQSTVAYFKLAN